MDLNVKEDGYYCCLPKGIKKGKYDGVTMCWLALF